MVLDVAILVVKYILAFGALMTLLPLMVWGERKGSAYIQDRPGPNRAAIFGLTLGGLFHPLADVIKLLAKESVMPAEADSFYYRLAPYLVMVPALMTFVVIPFGDTVELFGRTIPLQVANLNVGVLYIFAIASLGVYGIMLAGWSSGNKYALLGALRSSAQMVSYELSLGLSIIGLVMIFGSPDLNVIVAGQGKWLFGWLPAWGVFLQPLGFILFLVALFAETNRNPFDLPEGESELVAGYHLEYSSMRFGSFFMAEYANICVGSALIATLFFGGWQVPFLENGGFAIGGETIALPVFAVVLLRVLALVLKILFFCWLFIWVRWTLPRFRYDQLMKVGWRVMLPLALLNVAITGILLVGRG
jgi:NADH-quinone oxidoreductase subunit H